MEFDAQRAKYYAERISIPRQTGTPGEEKVIDMVSAWLSDFGYEVALDPFTFTAAFDNIIRLEIFLGQLLIAAGLILGSVLPGAAPLPALLVVILVAITPLIHRQVLRNALHDERPGAASHTTNLIRRCGKVYKSANIVARYTKSGVSREKPRLVIMAHHDSKSQTLSLPFRISLIILVAVGGLLFAITSILALLLELSTPLPFVFGIVAIASGIPLLLLRSGNNSPGGLDNASGLGFLIHLAEQLGAKPDIHEAVEIRFVVTGAEEFSLMGARAYLSKLGKTESLKPFYLLNFDGIGGGSIFNISGGVRLRPGLTPSITELVADCSSERPTPLRKLNFPGLLMDHMPFSDAGLDAITLMHLGRPVFNIHTPDDLVDSIREESVREAGEVVMCLIRKIAQQANPSRGPENNQVQC